MFLFLYLFCFKGLSFSPYEYYDSRSAHKQTDTNSHVFMTICRLHIDWISKIHSWWWRKWETTCEIYSMFNNNWSHLRTIPHAVFRRWVDICSKTAVDSRETFCWRLRHLLWPLFDFSELYTDLTRSFSSWGRILPRGKNL